MREHPLLLSILAALASCSPQPYEDTGCLEVEPATTRCAPASEVSVDDLFLPGKCGPDLEIVHVRGEGERSEITQQTGEVVPVCCYSVDVIDHDPNMECVVGRPYLAQGRALSAPLHFVDVPPRSETPQARAADRAVLDADRAVLDADRAEAWALAGAGEHASVAAFSRLSLQLMALGAPSELLAGALAAGLDEVRHAEMCWAMAARFGGARVDAGEFPFGKDVPVRASLADFAAAALREGCLAETLGAHVAQVAAEHAADEQIRVAMTALAAEEATHAVLSFKIVAWALRAGGDEVRQALVHALGAPWPKLDLGELALRTGVPLGRLEQAAAEGVREIVRPATARLLGPAREPTHARA